MIRHLTVVALIFSATCVSTAWADTWIGGEPFPDVVAITVRASGKDTFDFDVTVSSTYDTPQRYADGFRVTDKRGKVYGERKLLHDHAGEQPFTRDLYGVRIPPGVGTVIVQARDQKGGYGGKSKEVTLPTR